MVTEGGLETQAEWGQGPEVLLDEETQGGFPGGVLKRPLGPQRPLRPPRTQVHWVAGTQAQSRPPSSHSLSAGRWWPLAA